MSKDSNRLLHIWQELKRRRVFKVVAMYAGAAYVLIELVNNVAGPLNLPLWAPRLVILMAVIGFPLATVLSWIFDITPEGIRRTGSMDETAQQELSPVQVRRRLKASDVIIAVLFLAVCILIYPKLFKKDKFESIRDEDGRISIAVMPFANQTGDSSLNYLQIGISSLIINGLGNSKALAVRDDHTMHEVTETMDPVQSARLSPSLAREIARSVQAETYITGSCQGGGGKHRILANLVDAESGNVIWTSMVEGDLTSADYLDMADALCDGLQSFLELEALKQKTDFDFREAYTSSPEAYRYYTEGMSLILSQDYMLAIEPLNKALEIDSTFSFAAFYIAWAYSYKPFDSNIEQGDQDDILKWIIKAKSNKDKLPTSYQYLLELWYAAFMTEDINEIEKYCDLLLSSDLKSRLILFDLGVTYFDMVEDYDKAIMAFERAEKISDERGKKWEYAVFYDWYARALHQAGDHGKEEEILKAWSTLETDDKRYIFYQYACALTRADTMAVNTLSLEMSSELRKFGYSEAQQENLLGDALEDADRIEQAVVHYRRANALEPENVTYMGNLADMLIEHEVNIDEGVEWVEKALELNPDNLYLNYLMGWAWYKRGNSEKALHILSEADNDIQYHPKFKRAIQEVEMDLASRKPKAE